MELTSKDKLDLFKARAPVLFSVLTDKYGYELKDLEHIYHNQVLWALHLIYINTAKNLKIIIKQEPCYTDHGFSVLIYNLNNNKYKILWHTEHHLQDRKFIFLTNAQQQLFSSHENVALISGITEI